MGGECCSCWSAVEAQGTVVAEIPPLTTACPLYTAQERVDECEAVLRQMRATHGDTVILIAILIQHKTQDLKR